MKNITIVCCYNNYEMVKKMLESLKTQTIPFEAILIDNRNNVYNSCASAYNSVLNQITTEYVLFAHQDILFDKTDSLKKIYDELCELHVNDILGFAGATYDTENSIQRIFSNIRDEFGNFLQGLWNIDRVTECETVDECLFGGYTAFFKNYPFDDLLCSGWHLYAVERCLFARKHEGAIFISPTSVIHLSPGHIDYLFCKGFYKLCLEYCGVYDYICTPCYCYSTKPIVREIAFLKSVFKVFIKRM